MLGGRFRQYIHAFRPQAVHHYHSTQSETAGKVELHGHRPSPTRRFSPSCRCMPFLNPLASPQVSSTPEYKESWCSQSVSHRSWCNGVVPLLRAITHCGFFHATFHNHNHDPQLLVNVSICAYDDEDPLTFAPRTLGITGRRLSVPQGRNEKQLPRFNPQSLQVTIGCTSTSPF